MAEVRDDLVPMDGFTNSSVRFAGFDAIPGQNGARIRFEITDEDRYVLGTFSIDVEPQAEGTVDAVVVEGYRRMKDVLRQWLHGVDVMHRSYAKRLAPDDE